ncbi:hypothetical protein LG3211_0188 [Lysobacter gummosus]|nr:hypothetical protein LG3211_0188 [Lysobacter gummosus]
MILDELFDVFERHGLGPGLGMRDWGFVQSEGFEAVCR